MMNTRVPFLHCSRAARAGTLTRLLVPVLLLLLSAGPLSAQRADEAPIREMIARLDRGETDSVRAQLPELVAKYQNNPGILYLQARVATDGIEAAKLYQSVLDNYPTSEWADDALYNLYQYYYAMGLYMTAELKMQQLRKEYPDSPYLTGKTTPAISVDTVIPPPPAAETARRDTAAADTTTARRDVRGQGRAPGTRTEELVAPVRKEIPAGVAGQEDSTVGAPMPYALQTGAFSTSENAQKQKAWFEDLGYTAEITNRVRGGRSLYLVWVGSFPDVATARRVLKEIQSKYNITPIVVER
jgi:cell division septation protein DedD